MSENFRKSKLIEDTIQLFRALNYDNNYISSLPDADIIKMICQSWARQFYDINDLNKYYKNGFLVDVRGICDDAYCPVCNSGLDEIKHKDENCPICHVRLDWAPWHIRNDN